MQRRGFCLIGAIVALLIQSGEEIPVGSGDAAVGVVGQANVGHEARGKEMFSEVDGA